MQAAPALALIVTLAGSLSRKVKPEDCFVIALPLPHLMFFESKCTRGCFPCSTWTMGTGSGLSLALLVLFKTKIQKKSFKGIEYLG